MILMLKYHLFCRPDWGDDVGEYKGSFVDIDGAKKYFVERSFDCASLFETQEDGSLKMIEEYNGNHPQGYAWRKVE